MAKGEKKAHACLGAREAECEFSDPRISLYPGNPKPGTRKRDFHLQSSSRADRKYRMEIGKSLKKGRLIVI